MSAHMKARLTRKATYKVFLEIGKAKKLILIPAKHLQKLEDFLEKYGESESILWEDLAKDRIAKYKKSGLALRGARYREGLSQKELSKRTGISQENISKMENGQRSIGEKVAKKLAKVLLIDFELLIDPN
ncbi:MAG: helix-turn-helix transcriptional regulator [Candidatus Rhabdochlamydia sp.]|jgi:DNA-binding XRE family transcriptional regulator